jgi:hypothetical protein
VRVYIYICIYIYKYITVKQVVDVLTSVLYKVKTPIIPNDRRRDWLFSAALYLVIRLKSIHVITDSGFSWSDKRYMRLRIEHKVIYII